MNHDSKHEFDRQLDDSLQRNFEPPSLDALLARVEAEAEAQAHGNTGTRARGGSLRHPAWMAVAASLVLAAGFWIGRQSLTATDPSSPTKTEKSVDLRREWSELYRSLEKKKFPVTGSCNSVDDLNDLASLDKWYSARTLGFRSENAVGKVTLLGCTFGLDAESSTLKLAVEGGPTILVFVRKRGESFPPGSVSTLGLNLYVRDIGSLCLYELSPMAEPKALDGFYLQ